MNHLIRFNHVFAKRLIWAMLVCAFLSFPTIHRSVVQARTFDSHIPVSKHRPSRQVSTHGLDTLLETESSYDPYLTGHPEEDTSAGDLPREPDKHESSEDELLLRPPR